MKKKYNDILHIKDSGFEVHLIIIIKSYINNIWSSCNIRNSVHNQLKI